MSGKKTSGSYRPQYVGSEKTANRVDMGILVSGAKESSGFGALLLVVFLAIFAYPRNLGQSRAFFAWRTAPW
jgi:hypothetical protein